MPRMLLLLALLLTQTVNAFGAGVVVCINRAGAMRLEFLGDPCSHCRVETGSSDEAAHEPPPARRCSCCRHAKPPPAPATLAQPSSTPCDCHHIRVVDSDHELSAPTGRAAMNSSHECEAIAGAGGIDVVAFAIEQSLSQAVPRKCSHPFSHLGCVMLRC